MAELAPWISIGMGGRWSMRLARQVSSRTSPPPPEALLIKVTSSVGAMVESIYVKSIPPNTVANVFIHVKHPEDPNYFLVGSVTAPSTFLSAPGVDGSNPPVKIDFLLETLFPPSVTLTANKGLWLAYDSELYVSLDSARNPGFTVYANGGEC